MSEDLPALEARVATLRREAAEVMSLIHSGYLPSGVPSLHPNFPGKAWTVGRRSSEWIMYAPNGHGDLIFVHHPGDMHGDVQAMELGYARDVAMALLAACEQVENQHRPLTAVPTLAAHRERKR